jgi:hypothetical protein
MCDKRGCDNVRIHGDIRILGQWFGVCVNCYALFERQKASLEKKLNDEIVLQLRSQFYEEKLNKKRAKYRTHQKGD